MLFLYFLTVILPTVTLQCAPHSASQPWTKTSNVNNHHHHHVTENFYLDNRTIYNKIVEIEKRIDKIEEMGSIRKPLEPEKPPKEPPVEEPKMPDVKPEEKPEEKPKKEEKIPEKEDNGKDCLSCPSQPPILDSCDTCSPVNVSPPFEYYACKAIEIKCGDDARKFKVSDKFQRIITENQFMLECRKGNWVYVAGRTYHNVEEISCLSA